jgi:glyoxylase-like metal-dependent hydrolase (beta-lactamase superfamily II)
MRIVFAAVALLLAAACADVSPTKSSGVERIYILNCGEGVAGDLSRWTPGLNEGKKMDFVDNCYLIKHTQGWMLWDTGVMDAIAGMPNGLAPADPKAVHWKRPKTLTAQLAELGLSPSNITYVGISHSHADHSGNSPLFTQSTLLVQKAEYEWAPPAGQPPRFKPELPVRKLEGDFDVFGDGSVRIISTPGHTPGHQSLLVKLPKTGTVLLSGDAEHFKDNWDNRRVGTMNTSKEASVASMQRMADLMASEKAQLWINHDKAQRDSLKMSPQFFD